MPSIHFNNNDSDNTKENTEPEDETTAEGKDQSKEEKTDLEEEDTELQVEYHSIEEITVRHNPPSIYQQWFHLSSATTRCCKPDRHLRHRRILP